jgi:hypothetical protein
MMLGKSRFICRPFYKRTVLPLSVMPHLALLIYQFSILNQQPPYLITIHHSLSMTSDTLLLMLLPI